MAQFAARCSRESSVDSTIGELVAAAYLDVGEPRVCVLAYDVDVIDPDVSGGKEHSHLAWIPEANVRSGLPDLPMAYREILLAAL